MSGLTERRMTRNVFPGSPVVSLNLSIEKPQSSQLRVGARVRACLQEFRGVLEYS
jgi:hypothetical protein